MTYRSSRLVLAVLALTVAEPTLGQDLFSGRGSSLGLAPLTPPRVTPAPDAGTSKYTGNQCKLIAGSCPTGRLVRSGNLCFCSTKDGGTLQGTSRTRPQGS